MLYYQDVPIKWFKGLLRREPIIKDHTAVKQWKFCKRSYLYRMVLGLTPKKASMEGVFAWGNAVHKFAEEYTTHFNLTKACAAAFPIWKKPALDKPKWLHLTQPQLLLTLDKLRAFFDDEKARGYTKTVSVEQPFNIEMPDGEQIGGRTDAIITVGSQQTWVRDYKTTSKETRYFRTGFDPNDQTDRYAYALSKQKGWSSETQINSQKADGIQYFVIENKTPGKTTKSTPKLELIPITRSNDQLVMFEQQQIDIHAAMKLARDTDAYPMEQHNCAWCDYRNVCTSSTQGSMIYKLQSEFLFEPWDHQKVTQDKAGEAE